MQQFKVSRQRLTLGGSKNAKSSAEYYFVCLGGTPKFETNAKKWVCGVIRDCSIYFTPV